MGNNSRLETNRVSSRVPGHVVAPARAEFGAQYVGLWGPHAERGWLCDRAPATLLGIAGGNEVAGAWPERYLMPELR